ncbi:MAG: hypothetical protein RL194_399, partial [Pseudomonadota bacterium]
MKNNDGIDANGLIDSGSGLVCFRAVHVR